MVNPWGWLYAKAPRGWEMGVSRWQPFNSYPFFVFWARFLFNVRISHMSTIAVASTPAAAEAEALQPAL